MKNLVVILILCCLMLGSFHSCGREDIHEQERYFSKINAIIKDLEFHSAKAKDGKIILYNKEYEPVSEIPFEEYDEDIKFVGAHKDGPVVYFITGGAVDDEWGVMFINDNEADNVLEGVHQVNRIGGNAYEYSTMYKFREAD